MTHVSPYSANAKGFTFPDYSLESRRPKPPPQSPSSFEPGQTSPPDEEKGRKYRSPSSSSLTFSTTVSLDHLSLAPGLSEVGDDADGVLADEWLGLARGGGVLQGSGVLFPPPAMAEPRQVQSRFSPEEEWAKRIEEMIWNPSETSLEIRNVDVGLVPDLVWELSTIRRLPASPTSKRAQMAKIQSAPPNQLFASSPASPSPPPSPARQPSSPATPTRTGATPRRSFGRTGTGPLLFGQAKVETAPPIKIYLPQISLTSDKISPELWGLANLTVLSLRNNQLTTLSPGVGRLTDLVELNLANNKLEYLPAEITLLEKLSNLNLNVNPWLPPPPDPHTQPSRQSPPLDPQAQPDVLADAPSPPLSDASSDPEERPRLLGPLKVNFELPSLREICIRQLLSPGQPSPSPSSSPARSDTTLLPSPPINQQTNPRLVIETYYDGAKEWARQHPHLAEPFLATLYPQGKWRSTFQRYQQVFDPRSNVCTSPAHDGEERVFYQPAVERMEWVSETSLKHKPEGEWANSTRSLNFGRDVGPRRVPLLWRGCGRGCLDWLEEGVGGESGVDACE